METINVAVNKRQLTTDAEPIIRWNTGYMVNFTFDEEWEDDKTIKIVNDKGQVIDEKIFTGNSVELPKIANTRYISIGVYAGDLKSTTPLTIGCKESILDYDGPPSPPTEDVYNQMMSALDNKAEKDHKHDEYLSSADIDETTEKAESAQRTAATAVVTAETARVASEQANQTATTAKTTAETTQAELESVKTAVEGKADKEHTHSEYAKSEDVPSKVSDLENDSGYLNKETDPTVPAWAKAETKPSYTAEEVGALPSDTIIPSKVSQLDNDEGYLTEHQDISTKADKSTTLAGYGIIDAYTKDEANAITGDIETALDHIIAIQNSLIGGGSE